MFVAEELHFTLLHFSDKFSLNSCHFDVFTKSTHFWFHYYAWILSDTHQLIENHKFCSLRLWQNEWATFLRYIKCWKKKKRIGNMIPGPKTSSIVVTLGKLRTERWRKTFSDHLARFLILWMKGCKPCYIFSLVLYGLTLNFITS